MFLTKWGCNPNMNLPGVYDTENDERHVERESHRLGVVCKVGKSNTAAETELGPMTRR